MMWVVVIILILSNILMAFAYVGASMRANGKGSPAVEGAPWEEHKLLGVAQDNRRNWFWTCSCGAENNAINKQGNLVRTEKAAIETWVTHKEARELVSGGGLKELEAVKAELEEQKRTCICKDL